MSLQFPNPLFVGQAVRFQGKSWIWDGVAWYIDETASRLDLSMVPAYLGQFVHIMPSVPPVPTFVSLSTPDLYGATFTLAAAAPLEGVKVYKNGELLLMDDGSGLVGAYEVNRAANRIDFITPLVVDDVITIGILTSSEDLAPGRVDVIAIKDLDTDWITDPELPTTGNVDGERTTFDLLYDRAGVGQAYAVVGSDVELAVFVGGVRQQPGIDYVVVGAELTMTLPPGVGVPFWALWYRPAGAAGGGGVEPPDPPLDVINSRYGWVPGTGLGWVDARGQTITVANAAARTALRSGIDIAAGTLVLQADTQALYRWTGAAWVLQLDAGTFVAPLGGRVQNLRSSTALARPAADSGLPGQFWVNIADRTVGYFDDGNDPQELMGLDASGFVDPRFMPVGMRPYGTQSPGSILLTDWNDAHLNGTAPVRAAAGATNRPTGADLPYAGQYIAMGSSNTGVLIVMSPEGDTVFVRPRNAGAWGTWAQVNSPGLDLSSAVLRANNLSDLISASTGRTNLAVLHHLKTAYAGDLDTLTESGVYFLGAAVTNGWTADGTGAGGAAGAGDAVLHVVTDGSLAFQLGMSAKDAAPAARPLRCRFKTGVSTWTPWVSIMTSDEVTAALQAFGYGTQMPDKNAAATGLVTEFFRSTTPASNPGAAGNWHVATLSRVVDAEGAQIAVRDAASTSRARLAFRQRGSSGVWAAWIEAHPFLSGTTAQRPVTDLVPGLIYFDTDLDLPIFRNAANTDWIEGGGASVEISATAPVAPDVGDLWFSTADPVGLFIRYDDGTSTQWVEVGGSSLPPFASEAEALAGVVADKVMSPALARATSGDVIITRVNLTSGNVPLFIPDEFVDLEIAWEGLVPSTDGAVPYIRVGSGPEGAPVWVSAVAYSQSFLYHSSSGTPAQLTTTINAFQAGPDIKISGGGVGMGKFSLRRMNAAGVAYFQGQYRAFQNSSSNFQQAQVDGYVTGTGPFTHINLFAGSGAGFSQGRVTVRGQR